MPGRHPRVSHCGRTMAATAEFCAGRYCRGDGDHEKANNLLATSGAITRRSPNMAKSPNVSRTHAMFSSRAADVLKSLQLYGKLRIMLGNPLLDELPKLFSLLHELANLCIRGHIR